MTSYTDTPADPGAIQARIDHIQACYREWVHLLPKLEAARQDWLRGQTLMRELAHFYFDGEFAEYRQALENGLGLDMRTPGEHSVMSEDTLWNAVTEQQALAWQWLRAAVAVLDRDGKDTV